MPAMLFAIGRQLWGRQVSNVINLHDTYAVQCECGNTGMSLLRSGKVRCDECKTEWSNLTWNCRDCPGDGNCCRNGGNVGERLAQ
jgi:hypothetical protein